MGLEPDHMVPAEVAANVNSILENGYTGDITETMLHGIPKRNHTRRSKAVDCDLVLVHGYCANRNPFELQPEDWTNVCYYSAMREGDPIASENDDFAKNVI